MSDLITQNDRDVADTENKPAEPEEKNLIRFAMKNGAGIEQIRALMDLQERAERAEAKKSFIAAMAEFKKDPPVILKDKLVSYGAGASRTQYTHATLENVVAQTVVKLSAVGISHNWRTEKGESGAQSVTCVLTHVDGHSEETRLEAPIDSSGGKNNIQALGSTLTYLQRYTLLSACGLAAGGMDDDAKVLNTISDEQFQKIEDLFEIAGSNKQKLCKAYNIDAVKDLLEKDFKKVVMTLNQQIKANKKKLKEGINK